MKNIVRTMGIAVFGGVVIVIGLLGVLFTDTLVKNSIEAAGTKIAGAQVDVAEVAVSYADQSIRLTGLAITDPDNPMHNAVAVDKLEFDVSLQALAYKRLLIEEMIITGMQFNTAREKSGEIAHRKAEKATAGDFSQFVPEMQLPTMEIPSVEEVLRNEKLESIAIADKVSQQAQQRQQDMVKRVKALPSGEKIAHYKQRVKEIKKIGKNPLALLAKKDEIRTLKREIKQDLNQVKDLRKEIATAKTLLNDSVKDIKQAPLTDIKRIREKYSLSGKGLSNLSAQLFGKEITTWVDQGWIWYKKFEPYLGGGSDTAQSQSQPQRGRGLNIRFAELTPTPEFVIEHIRLSNADDNRQKGLLSGEIKHINTDPAVWPEPITFDIEGGQIAGVNAFALDGSVDHRKAVFNDGARLSIEGFAVRDKVLSRHPQLPLAIKSGNANIAVEYKMTGKQMDLSVHLAISDLVLKPVSPSSSAADPLPKTSRLLLQSIAALDSVAFTLSAKGDTKNPTIHIASDLDGLLSKVIKTQLGKKAAVLESQLKEKITAMSKDKLNALSQQKVALDDLIGQVDGKADIIDSLLGRL